MAAFVRRIPGNFLRYNSLPNLIEPVSYGFVRGFSSKLLVKGMPFSTTDERLAEVFSQFGEVVEAKIIKKRNSNQSKGYGFVTFTTESDALKALKEMNGQLFDGRAVFVNNGQYPRDLKDDRPRAIEPPEPAAADNLNWHLDHAYHWFKAS